MKIYIYKGGLSIVKKSGVGSAVQHQEQMIKRQEPRLPQTGKKRMWYTSTLFFQIQCWQHGQPENRGKR